MSDLTDAERGVLRHALGLDRGREVYRNRYLDAAGRDESTCEALVLRGLMTRGNISPWEKTYPTGKQWYHVTQAGMLAVLPGAKPALVNPPKGGWPGTQGSRGTAAEWRAAVAPYPAIVLRETPARYEVMWSKAPPRWDDGDVGMIAKHRVSLWPTPPPPPGSFVLRRPGTVFGPRTYWWTPGEHAPSLCEPAGCGPEWWRTLEEAEAFRKRLDDSPAWTAMSVEEARQEEARLFWAKRGES